MAKKLINTKEISHEEWLTLRKKSIGGSDAGALVDMNPYQSPISLYADKMGLSKPKESNEAMRLGTDLEDYVARRWMEKTEKKVRQDNFMYQDDEFEFITANIDRDVVGENAGLECKTMSSFAKYDLEGGEVPAMYFAQCQHYMMVRGYNKMYLAILVLQRGLYHFEIERDEEFISQLRRMDLTRQWKRLKSCFRKGAANAIFRMLMKKSENTESFQILSKSSRDSRTRFSRGFARG